MDSKTITRRRLLAGAGAVTAVTGAVALTTAGRGTPARRRSPDHTVTYGLIGAGARGSFLLNRLQNVDNGRCAAVCDTYQPNLDAALKLAGTKVKGYKDHRELLADHTLDAVLIATPLYRHFDVTRDALLAGKHVFCEKSLVFKPEEIHALRALAAERPRQVIQVGLQRRYSPFYQMAKLMVDQGMIGTVTHIRAQWHRNGSGRRPVKDRALERQINWRFYREYSGGLTAELASHQFDVADWMFGAQPELVCGIGGIDFWKDGRETYDNIQLLFQYPQGRKLVYSAISTNSHLPYFGVTRPEFGEQILGTGGTIDITIGDAANPAVGPALAIWYREPNAPKLEPAGLSKENWVAGATIASKVTHRRGLPLLLPKDMIASADPFLAKELKYARRWLYSQGVMVPEEDRNPVDCMLEDFFACIPEGRQLAAGLEVGLGDSTAVVLSNLAMDEGRRVWFREIEALGRTMA